MTGLTTVLSIILYIFGIILLGVLIVLGIRLIQMLERADKILDNVEEKVNSLNGVFNVINKATTGIDLISSKVVNTIVDMFSKIFKRKKEDEDYYE